jgi:hypothetical protein
VVDDWNEIGLGESGILDFGFAILDLAFTGHCFSESSASLPPFSFRRGCSAGRGHCSKTPGLISSQDSARERIR